MLFKNLCKHQFLPQWGTTVYGAISVLLDTPPPAWVWASLGIPSLLFSLPSWLPGQQWWRGPGQGCWSCSSFCSPPAWALTYINVFHTFQIMANIIRKCLATIEQLSFSSITFPMIGTRNLGFPKAIFAELILSEVLKFSSSAWLKTLQEVHFLVHLDDDESRQVWLHISSCHSDKQT